MERKSESDLFSGFGNGSSRRWERIWQMENFSLVNFVAKDKINEREFCKLKITPIVFIITIQRIFPSWDLALAHRTIAIRGLSTRLFSFINEVFSCQ